MSYELRPHVPATKESIALSKAEFDDLVLAQKCLSRILTIEENYNMLVSSYVAVQSEIARAAFETTLRPSFEWVETIEVLQGLNRHVAAFLSIAHQYISHTEKLVTNLCEDATLDVLEVHPLFSAEYDSRFGYRVMSALRNTAQHAMLPTHGISFSGNWAKEEEGLKRHQSISLTIDLDTLRSDSNFNRKVLAELEAIHPAGAAFVPYMKDYLNGLASVQEKVRRWYEPHFLRWNALILDAISRTAAHFGPTSEAVIFDNEHEGESLRTLFESPAKRIAILRDRNQSHSYAFAFEVRI